jgi:hypothetical protein
MTTRLWCTLFVGCLLELGSGGSASAAGQPVKAPPVAPASPVPLDIGGFFDVSFKPDYISPRGLLLTNTGLTTQITTGLSLDLYKSPGGFINDAAVNLGIWNDLWSNQNSPTVGSWNEFDWWVAGTIGFAHDWKFGVTYVEFLSPPGTFSTIRNVEFSLRYSDAWIGRALTFNPYVKLFYSASGPSTVAVGKKGGTYDVELGFAPTINLKKYGSLPISLTAPTWVTVGPASFWNRGTTGCGSSVSTPCATSNAGVFSTGLTGKLPIDFLIPPRLGNWYVDGGFQYFHLINDSLLLAQTATGTARSFAGAKRDIVVGFAGLGFTY